MSRIHKKFRRKSFVKKGEKWSGRIRSGPLFVVMSGVPPAEGDLPLRKRDQMMDGDGQAMGVAAQIVEHVFEAMKGRFA
jgi:hypothetical protein